MKIFIQILSQGKLRLFTYNHFKARGKEVTHDFDRIFLTENGPPHEFFTQFHERLQIEKNNSRPNILYFQPINSLIWSNIINFVFFRGKRCWRSRRKPELLVLQDVRRGRRDGSSPSAHHLRRGRVGFRQSGILKNSFFSSKFILFYLFLWMNVMLLILASPLDLYHNFNEWHSKTFFLARGLYLIFKGEDLTAEKLWVRILAPDSRCNVI